MTKKKTDVIPENEPVSLAPETPEVIQPTPEQKVVRKAVVASATGLNLRRGPGLEVLKILPDGAELQLVDIPPEATIEGWCPVIAGDGSRGWVMDQYIQPLEG